MNGFELRDAMTLGEDFDRVVDAARDGEDWALRAVYEEHAPQVRGYLRGQGVAEPDELLGEVFLRVVRDFTSFHGDEAALRAWVLTIAHRRLVEEQRSRLRRLSVSVVREPRGAESTRASEAKAVAASEGERVNTMLAGLSSNQRSVVLLRALGDLSVEQVADVLGKTPRAVMRLQRRGLAILARGELPSDTEDEPGIPEELDVNTYEVTEERTQELTRLLGSVVEHAKQLRRDSDSMIHAVEQVIASLEAGASSPPEPREGSRSFVHAVEPAETAGAQPSSHRRVASPAGAGREEALLRATQMAIRGRARTEIEAMLSDELGIANPAEIVDQILGPGGR
jgi:RNA polymerase sigma factor (sigma-70 family)